MKVRFLMHTVTSKVLEGFRLAEDRQSSSEAEPKSVDTNKLASTIPIITDYRSLLLSGPHSPLGNRSRMAAGLELAGSHTKVGAIQLRE